MEIYNFSHKIDFVSKCRKIQIKVINLRAQRAHPLLNINNADKPKSIVNNVEIKLADEKQDQPISEEVENGAAFSPPPGKAPIAHMDSEEDFLPSVPGSKASTSRNQRVPESNTSGKMNGLPTENDPELLFCAETAYEAIKESNKESQRLLQVFCEISREFVRLNFLAFHTYKRLKITVYIF